MALFPRLFAARTLEHRAVFRAFSEGLRHTLEEKADAKPLEEKRKVKPPRKCTPKINGQAGKTSRSAEIRLGVK